MLEGLLYTCVSRGETEALVRLLPESPVYAAHFPGYPITPGVCILQMALECMGVRLVGAKDLKFTTPVLPSAGELRFAWTLSPDGTAQVNVFLKDQSLCARMSLSVQ